MGTDISRTYGKFIIAMLTSIALKRAYLPKFLRVPTYLFIDEFHNYVTDSVEKILAETRKYGLHLIIANQSLSQIDSTRLRNVMLGNTALKFIGNNSPTTLSILARETGIRQENIQTLQRFRFYARLGHCMPIRFRVPSRLSSWYYQLSKGERKYMKDYFLGSARYRPVERLGKVTADLSSDSPVTDGINPKPKFTFQTK